MSSSGGSLSPHLSHDIKSGKKIYSKKGCRECKRRKIKCDETKPMCMRCTRLDKVCTYPAAGERVARVSRRFLMKHPHLGDKEPAPQSSKTSKEDEVQREDPPLNMQYPIQNHQPLGSPQSGLLRQQYPAPPMNAGSPYLSQYSYLLQQSPNHLPSPGQISQYHYGVIPQPVPGSLPPPVQQKQPVPPLKALYPQAVGPRFNPPHIQNNLQSPHNSNEHVSTRNTSPLSKSSGSPGVTGMIPNPESLSNEELSVKNEMLFDSLLNREDLNLLASDLNNLVGTIMFESNFDRASDVDMSILESTSSNTTQVSPQQVPLPGPINPIARNLPIGYIKLKSAKEKYYLEEFYNEFSVIIQPFMPYDARIGGYFNPARDILLYCASNEPFLLAALLAQGAKMAFNKFNRPKDEEAYCHYLLKCLKLLGPALSDDMKSKYTTSRKKLASNIESVLITVLFLTTANASNIKQDWRPHLKGAKDLLLKYATHPNRKESTILVFCKTWFISVELLASLSSKKGGTLKRDAELDSLMRLDDPSVILTLREIGIIGSNNFNYILGFSHDMLPSIKDLAKVMNKSRELGDKASLVPDPLNTIRLLSEFYNQSTKVYISSKVYLTKADFANGVVPEGQLLDCQNVAGEKVYINWQDLSQQAYSLAGIITLLTKGFAMSRDDEKVTPITEKLIDLLSILKDGFTPRFGKWKPLMVQWPMFVGGLNCTTETQKEVVQKFFQLSGAGSATYTIQIIERLWNKLKNKESEDSGSDIEIDLVTY